MPPPPHKPWPTERIERIRDFSKRWSEAVLGAAIPMDERFPAHLESPFDGRAARIAERQPISFLSYYQLRK